MMKNSGKDPLATQLIGWRDKFSETLKTNPCQMTEGQSFAFTQLSLNEAKILGNVETFIGSLAEDKFFLLVSKRSEAIGLEINPVVLVFIAGYLCRHPGDAVVYLSYLRLIQVEMKLETIDMDRFSKIFPSGFLQEPEQEQIWKDQKLGSVIQAALRQQYKGSMITDNLLDCLGLFRD
jgi:hypothetical protein